MNIEKASISIFDLFGYILPGFVCITAIAILISSTVNESNLLISNLSSSWITLTIAAYYLGQLCHRIGSLFKVKFPKLFRSGDKGISDHLYYHLRNSLADSCKLELKDDQKINTLETYILAESVVVASGRTEERDSLMAREGFHKSSMIAFGLLSIILIMVTFMEGVKLSLSADFIIHTNNWQAALMILSSLLFTIMFRQGYIFYNRLKITNILLLALTLLTNKEDL
jgi:hypothetical protein